MTKPMKRGLANLLAGIDVSEEEKIEEKIYNVDIEKVIPNPDQPRKTFDQTALLELADSIRTHGIIQPLVVKRSGDSYIIIAGERRYRAAKLAGLNELPIIIKEYDQAKTREISLIENLQREDLNAIEAADAIHELMQDYELTQEEVARKLGKARPSITNTLRLLNLTEEVKEYVKTNALSAGHARALLGIVNPTVQVEFARKAIKEEWSVRKTEQEVKFYLNPEKRPKKINETVKTKLTHEMQEFVNDCSRVFATRVSLKGNEQKGRIYIDYTSFEDLQRIYEIIESLKK